MELNLCTQVSDCFCLSSSGQSVCSQENIRDTGFISQLLPEPCCVTTAIKLQQGAGRSNSFRGGIGRLFCSTCLSSASWNQAFGLGTSMARDRRTSSVTSVLAPGMVMARLLTFRCCSKSRSPTRNPEGVVCAPPVIAGSCEALEPWVEPRHLPHWVLIQSSTLRSRTQSQVPGAKPPLSVASLCTPQRPPSQPLGKQVN